MIGLFCYNNHTPRPQSGGGSQDLTYEYQIEIGKLAEQLRQKWNDEYDE